jgi:acetylglutamate kinase
MTLVIATMNAELYSELKEEKAIHSGMIPKLDNCFNSLSRGVQKIRIGTTACCKMMMLFARQ